MAVSLIAGPVAMEGRARSVLAAKRSSQSIQNERANEYHLSRMQNRAMIVRYSEEGLLASVPPETRYYYLHDIPPSYCYLRPWAKRFLDQISREYYASFHQPLRVTSMIRTVELQRRLERRNFNAAEATGIDRSSHLTGATLDISKHGMGAGEKRWLRRELIDLEQRGYVYAVEEFEQPCFHVMVFPNYRDYVPKPASQSLEADRTN
ncbi:MAG TPA: DUF5715 family protein [Candidatus Dormibacteraeota bacterium]|nr:DUF5715 family protein [Candidatus Dormibacteraeota bacterium]